jgi:cytochrome c
MKKPIQAFICAAMIAGAGLAASPLSSSAWAAETEADASQAEAHALLDSAVAKIKADGAEAAYAAFNDPKGAFVKGEHYVFVFDMNGGYLASGGNPKLVGTNAIDLKDAEGKALVREMIALAKRSGKGTVDYVWLNRATNRVERKHSYIEMVGDAIVGVGFYEH